MRQLTERKKEEILKAAARVFAQRGFQSALVEEVARAAGVGKGTVYRYFKDKEDLFFSIIDHAVAKLIDSMKQASRSGGEPADCLRGIFEALADFALDNKPFFKLLHQVDPRHRMKRFGHIRRQNQRILSITEDVIRKGMKSGDFRRGDARLWALAAASAANSVYMAGIREPKKRTTDFLLDLMLWGMAAGRETKGKILT
jgi:AcrR family transcriptional regulator